MTNAPSFNQLTGMSDEDLRRVYDQVATHTGVGLNFYLDELHRRAFARQQRWMALMTIANLIVASAAAVAAVIALASS